MGEISAAGDASDPSPSANEEDAGSSTSEKRDPPFRRIGIKKAGISAAGDASILSPSTNDEDARNSTSETRTPPLLSLAMLRRAIGDNFASLDRHELSDRVYAGVLLRDDNKQGEANIGEDQEQSYTNKYWVDKDLNKNCWMVLAKALQIRCDKSKSLNWPKEESCYPGNITLPVAELANVQWVDIKGKCKTIMLSPWTMYEVVIDMKMRSESGECKILVNFSLELPDGGRQGRTERLQKLENWTSITIGKFRMTPENIGEIKFSLKQFHVHCKSSLHVKGVVFRPAR